MPDPEENKAPQGAYPDGKKTHRSSGIDLIGVVPWGTHFCQFYSTKQDLLDILVPYFAAGLKNNEYCMWVTSEPLGADDARAALKAALPNYSEYEESGQIEIIPYNEWYTKGGIFDSKRVLHGWVARHDKALEHGFEGLRLTGNTMWLERNGWSAFTQYEAEVDGAIGDYNMIALCTYSLERCGAAEIVDVVANHRFALIKRDDRWTMIESSEAKRAEEALKESEKRFRDVVETSTDYVWEMDTSGKYLYMSPAVETILGYTPEEVVGKALLDTWDPQDRDRFKKAAKEILATGKSFSGFTNAKRHRDGRKVIIESSGVPLFDKKGVLIGYRGIDRDITHRLENQKRIRESEEKYRELVENANSIILKYDVSGKVTFFNEYAQKFFGYKEDEIIGKDVMLIVPKTESGGRDLVTLTEDILKRPDDYSENVNENVRKNGERVWVSWSNKMIRDPNGDVVGNLAVGQDVTERKKVEEALRERDMRFKTVADNTYDWEFWVDQNGRFVYCSPSCEMVTGHKAEEFLSDPNLHRSLIHPDDRAAFDRHIVEVENAKSRGGGQWRFMRPDGSVCWVEHVCQPVYGEKGEFLGTRGSNRNVTERKNAEEALRDSEERFKTLFQGLPQSTVVFQKAGDDFVITDYNTASVKFTDGKMPEYVGKKAGELYATRPDILEKFAQAMKEKTAQKLLSSYRLLSTGREIFLNLTLAYVPPDRIIMHSEDVTERKQAEEALQQARDRTATILEGIADTFYSLDERWRFTVVNPAAEKAPFGRSSSELLGKVIWDIYPNLVGTQIQQHYLDAAQNLSMEHYEARSPLNDRWYEVFMQGRKGGVDVYMRDINERKRIEAALREAEEKSRLLISYAPAMIYEMDYAGKRFLSVNDAMCSMTGYTREEILAMKPGDLIDTESKKKFADRIKRKLSGEDVPESVEYRGLTKDGRELYVTIKTSFTYLNGKPATAVVVGYDITERKRMEDALAKAEEEARLLVKYAPSMIYEIDFRGPKLISVNDTMCSVMGYSREELLAKNPFDLLEKDSRKVFQERIKKHLAGKKLSDTLEYSGRAKDGRIVHGLLNMSFRYENGIPVRAVVVAQDITERKKAEEQLRIYNEWLGMVQAASGAGFWDWNMLSGKLTWSKEFYELFGVPPEKEASFDIWTAIVHPDDREQATDRINRSVEERKPLMNEYRIIRPNGEERWIIAKGNTSYDEAGRPQRMSGICLDNTERKKTEAKIEHLASFPRLNPNPVIEVDSGGKVTYSNPAALEMARKAGLGDDLNPLLSGLCEMFADFEKNNGPMTIRREMGIGNQVLGESIHFTREPLVARIYAYDVTERRKAEAEIKESEKRLDSIVNGSSIPQFVIGRDHWVLYWNEALSKISGLAAGDIVGTDKHWKAFYDAKRPCLADLLVDEEYGNIPVLYPGKYDKSRLIKGAYESTDYFPKLGGGKWLYFTAVVIKDSRGDIIGALETLEDITERRKKEAELQGLNRTLKALSESNKAMMRATGEQDYLTEVCRIVVEDCGHAMVWIGFADSDQDKTVMPVASAGFEEGYLDSLKITWADSERGRGPTGTAIRTCKVIKCRNMQTDPKFAPWREEALKRGYASSIAFPLSDGEKRFGAITIYSREQDPFGEDEEALLSELAGDLSYGISAIRLRDHHAEIEEEVRETKDYLENLLNYANVPIIVWDPSFKITRFNRAFERLTGLTAQEAVGKRPDILFPEEGKKGSMNQIKNTLSGSRWEIVEIPILHRDGSRRTVLWNSANIMDDSGETIVATIAQGHDITERKTAEEALKESEEKYRMLVENANSIIMKMDMSGGITFFNEYAERFFGFDQEEVIGKSVVGTIIPEKESTGRDLRVMMGEVMKHPKRYVQNEHECIRRDKTRAWISWNNRVLYDSDGRPAGMLSIGTDMTERRKMERDLQRSEEGLRSSVKEKDALIKEVHHRVKNNMQVISSLMKLQSRSITDDKARDIFRQSQDRIKSIALIHEKLYQSKDLVHIDMQKYIEELAVNLFRSYDVDRRRIELSVSVGVVPIDVDMMIYCGLLINELVSNSLKYAFPGNMNKGKIFISMDCADDIISLIVGDDGVGLHRDLDIKNSGTLGMRLVSDLAERQLKGQVEIDRTKGTVFKISFKTNI